MEGDFDIRIITGHVNIAFTPDLVWNTIVQYDNVSRQLGVDSRDAGHGSPRMTCSWYSINSGTTKMAALRNPTAS